MRPIALVFPLILALAACAKSAPPSPPEPADSATPAASVSSAPSAIESASTCPEHSTAADGGCAVDADWKIEQIALGYSYGCARYTSGAVRCAGTNEYGQLATGDVSKPPAIFLPPNEIKEARGAIQIAVGSSHACALMKDGTSLCWGLGQKGEIGSGFQGTFTHPDPVRGLDDGVLLMASSTLTCGIDKKGAVSCWGANDVGQLGDGTHDDAAHPSTVKGVAGAKSLASDGFRVCALLNDGRVSCWGRKSTGKSEGSAIALGLSHVDEIAMSSNVLFARVGGKLSTLSTALPDATPKEKADVTDATALAVGRDHACVLRTAGDVLCFGANERGQLGDGTTSTRVDARAPKDTLPAKLIAASADVTCVVHKDDTLSCWGDERQGLAKIAMLGATPRGEAPHLIPAAMPLPPYVPTPGTAVVEVKLTDALKLATGTTTTPNRSTLYYRVPSAWLADHALRPEKKDAMLAKLYGPTWKDGNSDGSTYVVKSFEARDISNDEQRGRPWLTAPTPKWFYRVGPDGALVKTTQDKF